jgi:hypothetical protein
MANNGLLTTPITVQNITRFKIADVAIAEDGNSMVVGLHLSGAAGIIWEPDPYLLTITNGDCDGLAAPPTPAKMRDSIIAVKLTGAGVAAAFTTCWTAYRTGTNPAGRTNLLNAMQAITGTVVGGPLDGQTKPIIPPMTVT